MEDAIDEFIEKWPRDNLNDVVFYFAGHGCSTGMNQPLNLLRHY